MRSQASFFRCGATRILLASALVLSILTALLLAVPAVGQANPAFSPHDQALLQVTDLNGNPLGLEQSNPWLGFAPDEIRPVNIAATPSIAPGEDPGFIVISAGEGRELDEYMKLANLNARSPRTSRTEDFMTAYAYYVAVIVPADQYLPHPYIRVYKNTGDPAATAWQFVLGYGNVNYEFDYPDLEIVNSNNRGHLIFHQSNGDIRSIWWQLSNPANNGTSTIATGADDYAFCSLTSDEVEFTGAGVYLYACWLDDGGTVHYSRSTNSGGSWSAPVAATDATFSSMYAGNSIAFCPGSNKILIAYTNQNEDVRVASSSNYGTGAWASTTLWSSAAAYYVSGGIASMYENYILMGSHTNTFSDEDICVASSSDGGSTWNLGYLLLGGDQQAPSCAANDEGFFNLLYVDYFPDPDYEGFRSYRTKYDSLNWYLPSLVDGQHLPSLFAGTIDNSACIEDGMYPDHGGAYDLGNPFSSDSSFFGWGGPSIYSNHPLTTVTLVGNSRPINIPVGGGSFTYSIYLTNNDEAAVTLEVWAAGLKPNGQLTPPKYGPESHTLNPGTTIVLPNITQPAPGFAPAGTYVWYAYIGEYPDSLWDWDSIPVAKLAAGSGSAPGEMSPDADPFPPSQPALMAKPALTQFPALCAVVSPNPFNPSTVIKYHLPQASFVKMGVIDISGRLVATLADGWREAGVHSVTFEGSHLPSGIYLYRLAAGEIGATGKLVLIK